MRDLWYLWLEKDNEGTPKGCLMVGEGEWYIDSIGLSYVDGYRLCA